MFALHKGADAVWCRDFLNSPSLVWIVRVPGTALNECTIVGASVLEVDRGTASLVGQGIEVISDVLDLPDAVTVPLVIRIEEWCPSLDFGVIFGGTIVEINDRLGLSVHDHIGCAVLDLLGHL